MRLRDRWRYSAASTRFWNWRGQKARERGRRDIAARIGDQVRSRTPVVRSRINRGTGRPHRDDRMMGRLSDQSLARFGQRHPATRKVTVKGRWFPGFRTGTAEQVQAYRGAERDRYRNERYEGKARVRWETDRSDRLNGRVAIAERPLSGTQRWWHRQVAATEVDREFTRLQRASDRQDRGRRGASRGRSR